MRSARNNALAIAGLASLVAPSIKRAEASQEPAPLNSDTTIALNLGSNYSPDSPLNMSMTEETTEQGKTTLASFVPNVIGRKTREPKGENWEGVQSKTSVVDGWGNSFGPAFRHMKVMTEEEYPKAFPSSAPVKMKSRHFVTSIDRQGDADTGTIETTTPFVIEGDGGSKTTTAVVIEMAGTRGAATLEILNSSGAVVGSTTLSKTTDVGVEQVVKLGKEVEEKALFYRLKDNSTTGHGVFGEIKLVSGSAESSNATSISNISTAGKVGKELSRRSATQISGCSYLSLNESIEGFLQRKLEFVKPEFLNSEDQLGVTRQQLNSFKTLVNRRMIRNDLDHRIGETVSELGHRIKTATCEVLDFCGVDKGSLLGQRLLAEGVCGWVRSHLVFNAGLDSSRGLDRETRKLYWTSETLLCAPKFFAICAGFSRLTQDLGRAVGLECYQVSGVTRKEGDFPPSLDHSWDIWVLVSGDKRVVCMSDNSRGRESLASARARGTLHDSPHVFPSSYDEVVYFVTQKFLTEYDGKAPPPEFVPIVSTFNEWKGWGGLPVVLEIDRQVRLQFPRGDAAASVDTLELR